MREISRNAFPYPMPVTIVGAVCGGRPNWLAVGWVARVNAEPPLLAVALNKRHHTTQGIREHRQFSVSVPGIDLLAATDHVGLVSGRDTDKSAIFEVYRGRLEHAPMVAGCPLVMECELTRVVELPTNDLFIGEIVGAYADEEVLLEGQPCIERMAPFMLTMPDNRYWRVGEQAGLAWSAGKGFESDEG